MFARLWHTSVKKSLIQPLSSNADLVHIIEQHGEQNARDDEVYRASLRLLTAYFLEFGEYMCKRNLIYIRILFDDWCWRR